jgi:hypothetical protein
MRRCLGSPALTSYFFKFQPTNASLKLWSKRVFGNAWIGYGSRFSAFPLEESELRWELKSRVLGLAVVERI